MSDFEPVRGDLIQALVSVVSKGIQDNQLDDAEKVILAIKALCPEFDAVDQFLPYIAIKRGYMREALQMYADKPSDDIQWYAMMALCLKLVGDPTWHWHAMQAESRDEGGRSSAGSLAYLLLEKTPPSSHQMDPQGPAVVSEFDMTAVYADSYMNFSRV